VEKEEAFRGCRMSNIHIYIVLFISLYIVVDSAHSGGFIDFRYSNFFRNNLSDEYTLSDFSSHSVVSGVIPSAELSFYGHSQIGKSIPTHTDYKINLTTYNSYYSRMASRTLYESGEKGQIPINYTLNVDTFLLMPKKFDSIHAELINISEDGKSAEVKINFTYDNIDYEFTNQTELVDGKNTLTLILQPFCDEFEGLGIDTDETFSESASANGLDYAGSLTIQAMQE
jgi:hypothetical protein